MVKGKINGTRHSIQTKVKIAHKLNSGAKINDLSCEYRISEKSVRNIKKQAEKLRSFHESSVSNNVLKSRKNMKKAQHPLLEKILFTWFTQACEAGIPITDNWIEHHAKLIYKELGGQH